MSTATAEQPVRRTPTPPPAGPWRLLGWDQTEPGSASWLHNDQGRSTRRPENAATFTRYADAERLATVCTDRMAAGLPRWMPVLASRDLDELQATFRRPRPESGTGAPKPPSVHNRTPGRASRRPQARTGVASNPFADDTTPDF